VAIFLAGLFVVMRYKHKEAEQPQAVVPKQILSEKQSLDIEEQAVGEDISQDAGPDIDDELLLDDVISEVVAEAHTAVLEISARQHQAEITNTPVTAPAEKRLAVSALPELYIAGVIWDFTRKYVIINGMPLREDEIINDVVIKKISYSYLIVEYNSKEYEIVLE